MKYVNLILTSLLIAAYSTSIVAQEAKTRHFGAAEVFFDQQETKSGSTILTLIAQIPETNDVLRGLKNTDQRRLSKLGNLVYQCKLLVLATGGDAGIKDQTPSLTSRNFSLFTGINLPLRAGQRIGIQVKALQAINETSLFNVGLTDVDTLKTRWQTLGEGAAINLQQFDLVLLSEPDMFETSVSLEISARFPIFQMAEPVTEWRYHFDLTDFKRAVRYIDDNCSAAGFRTLMNGDV